MQALNLPTYSFNIKSVDGAQVIFDPCRQKWVALTPEEWVRQHLVQYLIQDRNYPASLVSTEMALRINQLSRRCDIVAYDRAGEPRILVECKAPSVKLNQQVFNQVAQYNWNLRVPYLLISNGLIHYCARLNHDAQSFHFTSEIPDYDTLSAKADLNS